MLSKVFRCARRSVQTIQRFDRSGETSKRSLSVDCAVMVLLLCRTPPALLYSNHSWYIHIKKKWTVAFTCFVCSERRLQFNSTNVSSLQYLLIAADRVEWLAGKRRCLCGSKIPTGWAWCIPHPKGWCRGKTQHISQCIPFAQCDQMVDCARQGARNASILTIHSVVWEECGVNRISCRSQPSFGKLNVPKPASVTSERRTSFFGRR